MQRIINRLLLSSLINRLLSGTIWSILGSLFSRIIMLCSNIVIAKLLGKDIYGEYSIINSTTIMFSTLASFGLGQTATKVVAESWKSNPLFSGRVIAMSSVVAFITGSFVCLILIIFADYISMNILQAPHIAPLIRISSLTLIFGAINSSQVGVLSGFEAFKEIAKYNLYAGIAAFPLISVSVWLGGLSGAIIALTLFQALICILFRYALIRKAKSLNITIKLSTWFSIPHLLWSHALPIALSGLMVTPVFWIANAIIVNQPNGYGELALLNAANQFALVLQFFGTLIAKPYLPILSSIKLSTEAGKRTFIKTLLLFILFTSIPSILIGLIIYSFSDLFMSIYGAEFVIGASVLRILIISSINILIANVLGYALTSLGKNWISFLLNVLWAIIFILIFQLYFESDAFGYAKAHLISYSIHFITSFIVLLFVLRNLSKTKTSNCW